MKSKLGNVAIYIRVANSETRKEDSYIEFQKKKIELYLKKNYSEYNLSYFIDNGFSSDYKKRPALIDMLKRVSKNEFEFVITHNLSSLYRNVYELIKLINDTKNINYIFVQENIDTSKNDIFLPILAVFDEVYKSYINKSMKD